MDRCAGLCDMLHYNGILLKRALNTNTINLLIWLFIKPLPIWTWFLWQSVSCNVGSRFMIPDSSPNILKVFYWSPVLNKCSILSNSFPFLAKLHIRCICLEMIPLFEEVTPKYIDLYLYPSDFIPCVFFFFFFIVLFYYLPLMASATSFILSNAIWLVLFQILDIDLPLMESFADDKLGLVLDGPLYQNCHFKWEWKGRLLKYCVLFLQSVYLFIYLFIIIIILFIRKFFKIFIFSYLFFFFKRM